MTMGDERRASAAWLMIESQLYREDPSAFFLSKMLPLAHELLEQFGMCQGEPASAHASSAPKACSVRARCHPVQPSSLSRMRDSTSNGRWPSAASGL